MPRANAILLVLAAGLAALTAGCSDLDKDAGVIPAPGPRTGGSTRTIEGDWDDLEAVVDIAVTQSQCGFLEWHSDSNAADRRRWYTLLNIREEQVALELRRDSDAPPRKDAPEPITLTCKVGAAGDSTYEKMILDRLEKRFADLKGDKTAPIANPWGINE